MSAEERRALAIKELEWVVGRSIRFFSGQSPVRWMSQEELDSALSNLRSLRYDPNTPLGPYDNGGARIISREDQERLKHEFPHWPEYTGHNHSDRSWSSIFLHCDNVRVLCERDRVNVPQWYSEKYSHMFYRPAVVF